MLRRHFSTRGSFVAHKHTTSSLTQVATLSLTTSRFNATNTNSNESEAEREARMRQEMMNKMMSGRNPFAGMFNKNAASGAASGATTPPSGSAPLNPYFDASNYNHWANTPFHRSLRFWSSVLIFITGVYMMRRMGLMGDYSHLTLPYWATSPADQTKWVLFIFNIEDARRRQLVKQWESEKVQNPSLSFFDFVDRNEQYWRSSPNFSGDSVVTAVSSAMRTQGPPRAITSIKATLSASNFFSSTVFGGTGNPADQRAQKIDSLMMNLGNSMNPLSAMMGGGNSPMGFLRGGGQQPAQQQQQQQPGSSSPYQQGGFYAMPTGFVSNSTQQMYGGMNPSQLQQFQQQGGYNVNPYGQAHNPYMMSGSQPQWGGQQQFMGGQQQQQQQQEQNSIISSSSIAALVDTNKNACNVQFLNDQQQQVTSSSSSSSERPQTAPAGAAEMKDQQ